MFVEKQGGKRKFIKTLVSKVDSALSFGLKHKNTGGICYQTVLFGMGGSAEKDNDNTLIG